MRKMIMWGLAAVLLASAAPGFADLQSVTTSGSIRIRGDYANVVPLSFSIVEQRTRLGLRADFTDGVNAVIELDDYMLWGEDFRSNPWTGADMRAASGNDVEMYQAYIEANEMWGTPLRLRVGRQEMAFGNQWMVGVNDANPFFTGLSFDGLRLTYATESTTIDAWWTKVAETFGDFGDDDTDFYGVYLSCAGIENWVFDGYWLYVRDDGAIVPGVFPLSTESDLHTLGLRAAGRYGAWDFEAEVAYQFGDVEVPDSLVASLLGIDNDLDYDEWGANAEVGYSLDMKWNPRLYLGGAYLGGGGGDDLPFNRVFSNREYSPILDDSDLSNVWLLRGGAIFHPTESLTIITEGLYVEVDEELPFADDEIGYIQFLVANYRYSADLSFELGYFHIFTDDGVRGNMIRGNGLAPWATPVKDYDYLYLETKLAF